MYARHQVTIWTDHKALEYYKEPHKMNQWQARWHVELSQFDLKIEYKPGKLNVLPDILSRDPAHVFAPQDLAEYNTGTMLPPHLFALIDGNYHAFRNKVLASQKTSELGKSIFKAHATGPLNKSFQSFSVINGVIHHKGKLWVPLLQEQLEVIRAKHDHPLASHMVRTKLIELITRGFLWNGIRPQVIKFLAAASCVPKQIYPAKNRKFFSSHFNRQPHPGLLFPWILLPYLHIVKALII